MNQRYTPRDRYPRTLEEAFGPNTSREFVEPEKLDPINEAGHTCVLVLSMAALLVFYIALLAGWLE